MVARKFSVLHNDSTFDIDYDTDDGFDVFRFQLFSLTSIPPDLQKIVQGDDDRVLSEDADLLSVSDKLKLLSVSEKSELGSSSGSDAGRGRDADLLKSDEEFARMLQAEEEALMLQQFAVSQEGGVFEERIRPYISQLLMYEDPVRQEAARKTVSAVELEERALISLAKDGNFKPTKVQQEHSFLLQLLFWFKQSFRWVNAPQCEGCGSDTTAQGMGAPLPSETRYGASRVEVYSCRSCPKVTRFPRYNDPLKLVETRKGRCGEWANCFTLYCRAFGYESRLILDFTDHVWTECFSQLLGRWMHLDPCEGVYDQPLLYEKGWNKKLNYVIAVAKDGVYDVTKRYTRKWPEVISRRNLTTESSASAILKKLTKECRVSLSSHICSALEDRDKNEVEELERDLHSSDASVSLPGRQSGNKEWRISRSEIGPNDNWSINDSSCTIRLCIDEHVTRIYNAFLPILSHFVENSFSGSRGVQILEIFKGSTVDLRKLNYKTRKTLINPFMLPLLPYFDELLGALSLKREIDNDGKVDICLAGHPVKTALALPVALDTLDDMICNIRKLESLGKDSFSLPLLRLNRIHSGTVLASSEELPFGIATSAFDGLRASKWEEPNGAKGCWIVYKLSESQMHEVVAYDLMSANDAPERDPMDWVLEGSDDGGSNWRILDKRVSQVFEIRFQRKTFTIESETFRCNTFRFRFLAVKDAQSTSRLQLGSIDLYARDSTRSRIAEE